MSKVFISYSRKDIEFTNVIAAELRNRGAEVFVDYQKLEAGSFVKQLGKEIEDCDIFLLIISPKSVDSPWVQAELTWAFMNRKKVIPLILEDASMTNVFIVVGLEQIDFTYWKSGKLQDISVEKLTRLLQLPLEPITEQTIAEELPQPPELLNQFEEATDEDIRTAFSDDDVNGLFLAAANIADEDPEQAIYLYHKVLEIDPNHANGETRRLVSREEDRLKPERIRRLLENAEKHIKNHEWNQARRNAMDAQKLKPNKQQNIGIQSLLQRYDRNIRCTEHYEHVITAAEKNMWNAVRRLIADIKSQCPEFGDPQNIIEKIPTNKD